MQSIRYTGLTHPGMKRTGNEDAYLCQPLWTRDLALLLVIDGVGGYAGGNRAANIARESIRHYMQTPKGDTLTMLREAIIFANNRIREEREKVPRYAEMCCVLTAVITDATQSVLHYVHVGDTRLYRFRDGKLSKITRDHSFVGVREDAGELTEVEAMQHPQRNMILREVGSAPHRIDDGDFMDFGTEDFVAGDSILMCTDGLSDMIDISTISSVMAGKAGLSQKAEKLITLANEAGGHDNITVVIATSQPVPVKTKIEIKKNPVNKTIPVITPVEEPATIGSKKSVYLSSLIGAIAFLVLFGLGWFFIAGKSAGNVTGSEPGNTIDTLTRKQPAAPPSPTQAIVYTDTIFVANTLTFADLIKERDTGRARLILLPTPGNNKLKTALDIFLPINETISLTNIEVKGFETGIRVAGSGTLRLDNIVFENVKNPLSLSQHKDSSNPKIIILNQTTQ